MLKIKVTSLGCAKNLVDSEVMTGLLVQAGYQITDNEKDADVLVVNTCGFIDAAKEESVGAIMEAASHKTAGSCRALIVTGCLAQRYKDEILAEIPEIDGLLGTGEFPQIAAAIEAALAGSRPARVAVPSFIYDHQMPRVLATPRYSAYLKVAEGCDNRCTYCAIPVIRGEYRSRPMESIILEAASLVSQGVREINLIAQDTTRYGLDLYNELKLAELLTSLIELPELAWLRVLYAYPSRVTDRLIEVMAGHEKICNYIDIPLQHADDRILQEMHRQGTQKDLLNLVDRVRRKIPEVALRTSFIVGFPGETEESFRTLVEFVKTVQFDRLGVFTYSPEDGTPAAALPDQVPDEIKEERRDRLMEIQQEISYRKNKQKIGRVIAALIEGKDAVEHEVYVGRTEADAPEVDGKILVTGRGLESGRLVKVRVTHAYEHDVIGEVL